MKLFRSGLWVNFTLFFFVWVLLFPSAYADQSAVPPVFEATPANLTLSSDTSVYYVTPEEARRLEHTFLKRGYQVKRGTPEQLAQLRDHRSDTIRLAKSNITQTDQADDDTVTETKKQQQKKDDLRVDSVDLRNDLRNAHQLQRDFYFYNYPDPHTIYQF